MFVSLNINLWHLFRVIPSKGGGQSLLSWSLVVGGNNMSFKAFCFFGALSKKTLLIGRGQEMYYWYELMFRLWYLCKWFRWIPPPIPTNRSPENGKDSSKTFAAGKNKVGMLVFLEDILWNHCSYFWNFIFCTACWIGTNISRISERWIWGYAPGFDFRKNFDKRSHGLCIR